MSNIFVTDIIGTSTYAVPTDDTELAAATSGLDTLISGVANLAYDRVLAWVEDAGGPGGAEGTRTLNCLIEKFTYLTKECPSETEVDTMTAAIEAALEADANITSVNQQQVHIFQAGAYFLWQRDAAGGFLYPNTATDDVAVGPFASPNGKWFDDGDLVLGGNTMSGTEVLRVIGDARLEGGLLMVEEAAVPIAPAATEGVFWVRNDTPNLPMFTDDASTDRPLFSFPNIDQVLFVDKASPATVGADGSPQKPYNTIGAAITAANGLSPTSTNRIWIAIYPGIYAEAVVTQDDYVDLVGFDKHTTIIQQSSTSRPLTIGARNMAFRNLTFECASGCTANIVYRNDAGTDLVRFDNCDFLGTNGNAANYVHTDRGNFEFHACRFIQGSTDEIVYYSPNSTSTGFQRFYNCEFEGCIRMFGSDTMEFYGCNISSSAANGVWFGTVRNQSGSQKCKFFACYLENTGTGWAVYNTASNSQSWVFEGCEMVVNSAANDIDGTNFLQSVRMSGNSMSKGMTNAVWTIHNDKYAGGRAGELDWYTDLEDAVAALTSNDDGCTIHMLADFTSGAQVSRASLTIQYTIDGHDHFWTDTAPASGFTFLTAASQVCILRNINFVDAAIRHTGNAAVLVIDNCNIEGAVSTTTTDTDGKVVIHDSSIVGISDAATLYSPVELLDADPTVVISQSYLKGYNDAAGYAIDYNSVANDNVQIEHSTLMHGQLGSNNPFGNEPSQVDYAAHHTTFNVEPDVSDPAGYNNVIDLAQRQNTIDPDGDYGWRKYV
jgi:hypothetical protein